MGTVLIILIGAAITLVCGLAFLALSAPRTEAELGYEAFMDSDPAPLPPWVERDTCGAADGQSGGPVFLPEFDDCEVAGGPPVRSRPVLFRVK